MATDSSLRKRVSQKDPEVNDGLRSPRIVSYGCAPDYLKDNPHIHTGYRVDFHWSECLRSIFSLHNETFNVWTHLVGVFFFIYLLCCVFFLSPYGVDHLDDTHLEVRNSTAFVQLRQTLDNVQHTLEDIHVSDLATASKRKIVSVAEALSAQMTRFSELDPQQVLHNWETFRDNLQEHAHALREAAQIRFKQQFEHVQHHLSTMTFEVVDKKNELSKMMEYLPRWPIVVFMMTAILCLFFSATFHTFIGCSHSTVYNFSQKLDYAGITLLIGGSNVPAIFYSFYCDSFAQPLYLFVCISVSSLGFIMTMSDRFLSNDYRTLRTCVFLSIGGFGVIPLTHIFFHPEQATPAGMNYVMYMVLLYFTGALVYLSQVPERFAPGWFDIFLSSHQLWHLFVMAAAYCHFVGVTELYQWRIAHACPA